MDIQSPQPEDPRPSNTETSAHKPEFSNPAPIPLAYPFYMAMLVAFLALPLFWPDRLLNRLGYGDNMILGGPTTGILMALTMLLAPILLCLTQMLRK